MVNIATTGTLALLLLSAGRAATQPAPLPAPGPAMVLGSAAFEDGGAIPAKYTQAVERPVSPPLRWGDVPAGTISFALIVHDLDATRAKSSSDNLHWLVFNIPGEVRALPEGVAAVPMLPEGTVQGKNVGDVTGYRGPGAKMPGPLHHYSFELYALDVKLDLGSEATRADVLRAMDGHVLGKAALVGRYHLRLYRP